MVATLRLRQRKDKFKYLLKILATPSQRKHAYRWLRSQRANYLVGAKLPWITFDAIDYLERHVACGSKVFEYGSGSSTLFWLRLDAQCTSVEHDPQWFSLIRERVGACDRLDYRLVSPEPCDGTPCGDIADPNQYASGDRTFRGYSFKRYVQQIDEFADASFDIVSIDGRARPSCVMHGAAKIKPGGLLILDNADREYYTEKTRSYLQEFQPQAFYGVGPCGWWMWRTDIYTRRRP